MFRFLNLKNGQSLEYSGERRAKCHQLDCSAFVSLTHLCDCLECLLEWRLLSSEKLKWSIQVRKGLSWNDVIYETDWFLSLLHCYSWVDTWMAWFVVWLCESFDLLVNESGNWILTSSSENLSLIAACVVLWLLDVDCQLSRLTDWNGQTLEKNMLRRMSVLLHACMRDP